MHDFASNFLTFLERREEKLLSWGFHNIQYSESDMLNALQNEAPIELQNHWNTLNSRGITFKTFIRELRQSNLLYRLPDTTDMYRTRMAEGVRLLANLRQMFREEDWSTGPRLVSDIKIHLKSRVYPRRNIPAMEIWGNNLQNSCPPNSQQLLKECYEALVTNSAGEVFKFSGFQKRSFINIFQEYNSKEWTGSVICAGTGSGKTKAFYVPAFLRVAEELSKNPSFFTKVIAIYPRNVLLADQLKEALSEHEKIRPVLERHGLRPMTFGALLGSSPRDNWFANANQSNRQSWHWQRRGDGHVIPYLKSIVDGKSDLVWKQKDINSGRTSLYRPGESRPDIPDNILRITREQLVHNPPDIFFLSLEMLNREMGNPEWRKTFGIMQGNYAPRLILLDEVHTHEGISGAQAAWVLKRWKYWMRSGPKGNPPHFVGLSATLRDAPQHLARVCGIRPENVLEFSPKSGIDAQSEMEAEGQEYNLAIKGDPSSGSALLSTSIQTAMLLTRFLTNRNQIVNSSTPIRADEFFLKKAFGFTDNLDSLNRWFANMQDAERQCLARFRAIPTPLPDPLILNRMRSEGQIWELPMNIGHDLNQRLQVSRCSSQDPGANASSDLILATSSLEVGFDDPQVGMIFHHKSPTSMSSFIQRKGRAGRQRGSRPWTVVVLSDYGRDRWAFQSAERLFNPEIDRIYLPIANPYVLRVQMALFLVDWLGQTIDKPVSPFSYLSKPENYHVAIRAQGESIKYLKDFLHQGILWKRFFHDAFIFYFNGREGLFYNSKEDQEIARDELNDILWQEPRPLLTNAIPTLLRKLESNWQQMRSDKLSQPSSLPEEDLSALRPMPKSIPKATFEELGLTEARISLEDYSGRQKEDEVLSMQQFLRESCPGRVSKRFSPIIINNHSEPGYWNEHSLKLRSGQNISTVAQLYPENYSLSSVGTTNIYTPINARLIHIPNDVVESTNSQWLWKTISNIHNKDCSEALIINGSKPWDKVFSETTSHLHINGSWIDLLRYSSTCSFDIRKQRGNSFQGTLNLQSDDKKSEAIGFQLHTDGLRFVLNIEHLLQLPSINQEITEQFRYEYFLHQIKTSPLLQEHLNVFRSEWMAQISMAMLTATAILNNETLSKAQERLKGRRLQSAQRVLESIFQIRGISTDGQREEPRLQQDLLALWEIPVVVTEIERLEPVLWNSSPNSDFNNWVLDRYIATLAQAIRVAASTVSDQVTEEDLTVDVIRENKCFEIIITEKSSGGLGQVESITNEIKNDPRYFLDALEHTLGHCPREVWGYNLNAVSECVCKERNSTNKPLSSAFKEVREAKSLIDVEKAKNSLITAMFELGLNPQRNNVSAVSMKLLRPGSNEKTDSLTFLANKFWKRYNQKIGVEIPIRTFAYAVCNYPPSRKRLIDLFTKVANASPSNAQLYAVIQQLLFEGCSDSCPDCLNVPNYFNDFGKPARNLALHWLSLGVKEIVVKPETDEWVKITRDTLINDGVVCLIAKMDVKHHLFEKLVPLFFEEVNVDTYREPVHINRIEYFGGLIKVYLKIRDFTNVQS